MYFYRLLNQSIKKEIKQKQINNSLPEATIATTIDVVVEELCNNTVPKTPIIRPANGFETTLFDEKASPKRKGIKFQFCRENI